MPHSNFIYLDQTFIHKNLVTKKVLLCDQQLSEIKLKIGRGDRYSMIDTGSKNGFIKNSLLVLKNEELLINAEKFENWIKNQLLQNIKEKSVIILDNAPIHSK